LNLLSFTPKASAPLISKVLKSAVANAGQKKGVDVDTLIVKSILVDEGPTMKRFRARAMGRGTRILKRSSHLKIIVEES
jgi:large subunit ribosomal protein L22